MSYKVPSKNMLLTPIVRGILKLHESMDLPEYLYHVSPYTDEIIEHGSLIPNGMGAGSDFGRGFGGGTSKGISFFSDLNMSQDYANGILLAIMLSKARDADDSIRIFDDWASIQESRLGVDLSELREYFKSELERYLSISSNTLMSALKSVRQLVSMRASRFSPRLDDPVIYGNLDKFSNVNLNNLKIVVVRSKDIPADAEIKSGTDASEVRVSGAEIPVHKTMSYA